MARDYERSQRVASQLQRELADLIRHEIKDPRLGWVTVDDVEVSRDLSVAKVYVSTLEMDRIDTTLEILQGAAPFLRHELGKRLHIRQIPELRFFKDTAIEAGMRITQLLDELKKEEPKDE
ncbi:ribosome-binding factor A [Methylomarinovum caldicuralii]|uniref:Ribosome-binding factor A n=1 Tax=Methylomarinovum caldicuralii TaxID=438856 RepID=A0AAU9BZL4_9GAMM|nr:30S ribosome-binding factor RbfA [Methylomarinovum caldicuralii]BCX81820.1 ribosome-binding factor A [Methylomarinovum caldicuralii]